MSSVSDTLFNTLRPSLIAKAILAIRSTSISLYIHGAPGISKSAVACQVANELGIAFIDLRLSQMAPEDVRGVPMLGERYGMHGMIWEPPLSFPRNLDYSKTELIHGIQEIRFFNPIGNNGIHYSTKSEITIQAVSSDHVASIIDYGDDRFTVALRDATGQLADGMVKWQVHGPAEGILALEEFNSAPPSVMAAAYQLILDRRLGDYIVPTGVTLLAMGNRDKDKGVTYRLPKPLANRFIHLEMEVNLEDWCQWAIDQRIHPDVVGYIMKFPHNLLDRKFTEKPSHPFATPRTWEFVSNMISQNVAADVTRALICGAIGDAIGNEFLLHRQFVADMPDIRGIFSGQITQFHASNPQYVTQIAYSLCLQLCYDLKTRSDVLAGKFSNALERDESPEQNAWWIEADRAVGYVIDNFQPEIAVMMYKLALYTCKMRFTASKMKRFRHWAQRNHDLVANV